MGTRSTIQDTLQSLSSTAQAFTPTPTRRQSVQANRIAQGLGWFSIGLGLTELLAPRAVERVVGTRRRHGLLIRAYGLREVAAGVGILTAARPAAWLWARVAGDAADLGSIGGAASSRNRGKAMFSAVAVGVVTALDFWCARTLAGEPDERSPHTSRAEASMIVNRSPEDCYAFWLDFEKLPRFMSYLHSVRVTGERTSHWVANLAGNLRLEWDAEITDDMPNQRIAWRSRPGSEVPQTGSVEFERAHSGRGTIVRVAIDYGTPLPGAAEAAAALIGRHPGQMIRKELRRFKQVMETGEVITTEGQPAGRRGGVTWLDRVAR
jgi:uncharacterized membrane protein